MTDELRRLLIQVRDRLETEGLIMGIDPKADCAMRVWDGLNALIGCNPGCDCQLHDPEPHSSGKILKFPLPASK